MAASLLSLDCRCSCGCDMICVSLPAVGALGFRQLDDVAFACQVVAHDAAAGTISIQYTDDQQIEEGLDPDEFSTTSNTMGFSMEQEQDFNGHQLWSHDDRFERLHDHAIISNSDGSSTLFIHMASFLDHFQWTQNLMFVSMRWRNALLQRKCWEIVRLPSESGHGRSNGGALGPTGYSDSEAIRSLLLRTNIGDEWVDHKDSDTETFTTTIGYQVVQELVLDGCPVTDEKVLELISFLLLYELTRMAKDSKQQQLGQVDVWLCRGISPAYVDQLKRNGVFTRTGLQVTGPGFFILEVSAETEQWVIRTSSGADPSVSSVDNQKPEVDFQRLSIHFVSKASLRALFVPSDEKDSVVAREPKTLRDHVDAFPLSMIPLVVGLESILQRAGDSSDPSSRQYLLVGMPSTLDDLVRLAEQNEEKHVQNQLHAALPAILEPQVGPKQDTASDKQASSHHKHEDTDELLDARAEKVFAMLRQTTKDLESQVVHLESQMNQMTLAKDQAQQEYRAAQLALDRVAKEADRALLSLATSSTVELPPPPPPISISRDGKLAATVTIASRDGDELLPPLLSDEKLRMLGSKLESSSFAVLNGFLGSPLSSSAQQDLESMYLASRCNPDDTATGFKLGELTGGNTGRNLRYKMEHVRGDYMLWMDEHDAFCPESIRQALRQMDRLVLERLPFYNMELGAASLLRKKAMATCYPGNGARYTKHCNNPNKSGRKLTAILYLNANWIPHHGGELQLYLPPKPHKRVDLDDEYEEESKVQPLMDRLLLFFSDKRVPHEVLPCFYRNRFALTVWYLDYDEFMSAQVFGAVLQDQSDEEKRIQQEMAQFASESGG